jgi:hypothetical protein
MLSKKQTFDESFETLGENPDYDQVLKNLESLKQAIMKHQEKAQRHKISQCQIGEVPFWQFSRKDLKKMGIRFDKDVPVGTVRKRFSKYFEDYSESDRYDVDNDKMRAFYEQIRTSETVSHSDQVKFDIIYVDSKTTSCYHGEVEQTDCAFTPLICHFHVGDKIYKIIGRGFWQMDYLSNTGYMSPPFDNLYHEFLEKRKNIASGHSKINPLDLFMYLYFNHDSVPRTEVMETEYDSEDDHYQHLFHGTMYHVSGTIPLDKFVYYQIRNLSDCDDSFGSEPCFERMKLGDVNLEEGWKHYEYDPEDDVDFATKEEYDKAFNPDPKEILIKDKEITIVYDYPLNEPITVKYKNRKGFTRRKIIDLVVEKYTEIYEDNLDNIWGHSLGELHLNSFGGQCGVYYLDISS